MLDIAPCKLAFCTKLVNTFGLPLDHHSFSMRQGGVSSRREKPCTYKSKNLSSPMVRKNCLFVTAIKGVVKLAGVFHFGWDVCSVSPRINNIVIDLMLPKYLPSRMSARFARCFWLGNMCLNTDVLLFFVKFDSRCQYSEVPLYISGGGIRSAQYVKIDIVKPKIESVYYFIKNRTKSTTFQFASLNKAVESALTKQLDDDK